MNLDKIIIKGAKEHNLKNMNLDIPKNKLVVITGVMSRWVVTIGALFLVLCGLIPKIGAIVSSMPMSVLGGGIIIMFGMVAAAGINMLSNVEWSRRNMLILALSLSVGLGLQLVAADTGEIPSAIRYLPETLRILMETGLLPTAFLAVILNIVLPEEIE